MTTPRTLFVIFQCSQNWSITSWFECPSRASSFPLYFKEMTESDPGMVFYENILEHKNPNLAFRLVGYGMRAIFNDIVGRAYKFLRIKHRPGDQIMIMGEGLFGDRAVRQLCRFVYYNSGCGGGLLPLGKEKKARAPGSVPVKCIAMMGYPHISKESITEQIIQRFPPITEHFLYYDSVHQSRESHAIHYDPPNRAILSREIMYFDPVPSGIENELCLQWIKFYTSQFIKYRFQPLPNTFTHATLLSRQILSNESPATMSLTKPYGLAKCSIRTYSSLVQSSGCDLEGRFRVARVRYLVWYGRRE